MPPEGVFVQIGDVEQYIVDYDVDPTALASKGKLLERTTTQLIIGDYVSSDDEDYETDLEYDEEGWMQRFSFFLSFFQQEQKHWGPIWEPYYLKSDVPFHFSY